MWQLTIILFALGCLIGYAIKCIFDRLEVERIIDEHIKKYDKIIKDHDQSKIGKPKQKRPSDLEEDC